MDQVQTANPYRTDTPEARRFLFEQFLKCIDREENLIHYRLTWGMQWNLACFAAFFALQGVDIFKNFSIPFKGWVDLVISCFGILVSIFSFIGIKAAHDQSRYLIEKLTERLSIHDERWDDSEFLRPYGDRNTVHPWARRVSAFFPMTFIGLWALVMLYAWRMV